MACSKGFPAEKVRARNLWFDLKVLLSMPSRKSLVILLAFLFAVSLPASAQARQSIRGPGYKTYVPSGWKVKKTHGPGWHTVQVRAPGSHGNRARNSAVLSISSVTINTLRKSLGGKLPGDLTALVQAVTTFPGGSANQSLTLTPQVTGVAGQAAGIQAYTYDFDRVTVAQTDLVVVRPPRAYTIELALDEQRIIGASAAMAMVRQSWRWKK
jgi:hypothetical protein